MVDFLEISVESETANISGGFKLLLSQISAIVLKKFIFYKRNSLMVAAQLMIVPLVLYLTMIGFQAFNIEKLPPLLISPMEYLKTVTVIEKGNITIGSLTETIFENYLSAFSELPKKFENSKATPTFNIISKPFEDEILKQYKMVGPQIDLYYMVGATISDKTITAWFNNQGFHTAPLSLNLINNAFLRFEFLSNFKLSK